MAKPPKKQPPKKAPKKYVAPKPKPIPIPKYPTMWQCMHGCGFSTGRAEALRSHESGCSHKPESKND